MTTEIELHHIGEVVLAGILRELDKRGELDAECFIHEECGLAAMLSRGNAGRPLSFDPNVQLESVEINDEKLLFDGAHGIDVLCCCPNSNGLALEAKLGIDRMARGEFTKRFLAPVSLTSHSRRRIKGSMVAILNYRALCNGEALLLRTATPSRTTLLPDWFLVIRRTVWQQWTRQDAALPPLAPHTHVAIFEDIVQRYGDSQAFDQLVHGLVGNGFYEPGDYLDFGASNQFRELDVCSMCESLTQRVVLRQPEKRGL